MHKYKSIIEQYCQGWEEGNAEKILSTLGDTTEVIESHGPVYKGKDIVTKWIADWHKDGGKVITWEITSYYEEGDTVFFEWEFDYEFNGKKEHISGSTIAKIVEDKIRYLREYRTTESLFDYH